MTNMRILAGAALLDQHRPGWFDAINLSNLDQESTSWCVLGQLYHGYYNGRDALGLDQSMAVHYGFDSGTRDDTINSTDEWEELIANRQAESRSGYEELARDPETRQTRFDPPVPQLYTLNIAGLTAVTGLTWDQVSALVSSMPDVELTITRPGK